MPHFNLKRLIVIAKQKFNQGFYQAIEGPIQDILSFQHFCHLIVVAQCSKNNPGKGVCC